MATTTPRTPEETQAISRLRALGQGVRVYCLERDQMYCVPASAGDGSAYQIQVNGEITICSCPAGTNDKYCKHVAAVEMGSAGPTGAGHVHGRYGGAPRRAGAVPGRPAGRSVLGSKRAPRIARPGCSCPVLET